MDPLEANKILSSVDWHDASISSVQSTIKPFDDQATMPCVDVTIRLQRGVALLRLHECHELHLGFVYDLQVSCESTGTSRVRVNFHAFGESTICDAIDVYILGDPTASAAESISAKG